MSRTFFEAFPGCLLAPEAIAALFLNEEETTDTALMQQGQQSIIIRAALIVYQNESANHLCQ